MRPSSLTRVELWVEPRDDAPAVNPVMTRLLGVLAADGICVSVRVPEHSSFGADDFASEDLPDLVLLKSATSFSLSMALAGEARGMRCYNPALASLRAADKALAIGVLAAAGLPVAPTYLTTGSAGSQAPPPDRHGAWVTKPVRGVHGAGVRFHDAFPAEWPIESGVSGPYVVDDGVRLVQRRVGGEAEDVKIYVAGRRWFAGRKRFGPSSFASDEIEPVDLGPCAVAVVQRAGEALGLRCFGIDLRFEGDAHFIVDANPFPGFRGFPCAVPALTEEIRAALAGAAL